MCIIIADVYQFIGHCLIPLDLLCVCVFLIMRIIGFMTEVYEKLPYLLEVEPKQELLILGYYKRIFSIILKPIDIQWIKTGS